MELKLAHICLWAKDLEETTTFYCDVLGMKKVFNFTREGSLYGCYLEMSPGNYLEIFEDKEVAPRISGTFVHLCLETKDIEGDCERIRAKGVSTTDISKGCDNTYQIWFKDPNGLDIELHQYTRESSQLTGRDCEVDWL